MEDLSTITGRIIPSLLVTQLKALIKSLNETIRPPPQLKLSGNKSELISRLVGFVTQYHHSGDQVIIRQIRHCVAAFNPGDVSTIATPSIPLHNPQNNSSNIHSSSSSSGTSVYRIPPGSSSSSAMLMSKTGTGQSNTQFQNALGHRHQHPGHHPTQSQFIQHRPGVGGHGAVHQVFKSSPFYQDVQTLALPRLCMEAKDRTLSVSMHFPIPPMLAIQLKKDPEYQLMVFCGWADGPANTPVLMEFPHVCEIKVNGKLLEANLRGMKNKPGTVSPANITRLCRLETGDSNKVEFIYANSTKRYYASTHVAKKFSVESIVAEIERGKFLSKEKMLRMIEDRNKDDDIMATSSTLSLKCPLGFQRITIPCRSSYCQHLQCFDAFTFFNLNEQTPTWTCPVCSRIMHSWEEIVVDGYFKDILNSTPHNLESITVQGDGSWEIPKSSAQVEAVPTPKKKITVPAGESVFIIDEDDSDDEKSAAASAPSSPPKSAKPAIEIIDLISDSEDEEDEEPARAPVDQDGDTTMQDAATSLQNMAQSNSGAPPSVKTEVFDKPTPTEQPSTDAPPPQHHSQQQSMSQPQIPAAAEIHSITGSTSGSPISASSEPSPVLSARMVINEPTQTGPLSPVTRIQPTWDTGEDVFMNALLNPRRKRQYDDTGDDEGSNTMAYEARQRIARLDIRSNESSDRGSSSTIPSPDVVRRSTSSPTPMPTFREYDRRGGSEHRRSMNLVFYENGGSSSGAPVSAGHTSFAPARYSPQHHTSHISNGAASRGSRGATMSPPLHPGYNNASPLHQHHQQHRSTASPGPDYISGVSRHSSNGSMAAAATVSSRSNSTVTDRPLPGVASNWGSSSDGYPTGSHGSAGTQDRTGRWGSEQRYGGSGLAPGFFSESSSPRVSNEEPRSGSVVSASSSPVLYPLTSKYSSQQQQQQQSTYRQGQSLSHQQHERHHSSDDFTAYGRREGYNNGSHYHRSSGYGIDDQGRREGSGNGYVYSSNQESQTNMTNSVNQTSHGSGEDRRRSEGVSKADESPIFMHGFRGARAR